MNDISIKLLFKKNACAKTQNFLLKRRNFGVYLSILNFKTFIYLLFNSKHSSLENIKERPERFSLKDIYYDIVEGMKETQREQ